MVAVQGPQARELAAVCIDARWREQALALKPFYGMEAGDLFVARTGYTGEDGWEIAMPAEQAAQIWDQLLAAGIAPCGLGARDTLRLEAAMNLYGSDMDETISPLEAGWAGRSPGSRQIVTLSVAPSSKRSKRNATQQRFVGLLLEDKGVLRNHQRVVVDGVRRGRNYQRRIFADDRALDRAGSCAGRRLSKRAGRCARQAFECTDRANAIRA